MKRDDLTGLALGGNKARKLEFLLGQARQLGCDVVITVGGVHVDAIVHASNSGGTQSGLYTGTKLTDSGVQVIGISAGPRRDVVTTRVLGIVSELVELVDMRWRPHPDDLIVYDDYVGE